jgi:hypothetical protein
MREKFTKEICKRITEQFPNVETAVPFWDDDGKLRVRVLVAGQTWIYRAHEQTFDKQL